MMCFLVGLTLLVFSILGVINPFAVFGKPKDFLANVYIIIFSAPGAAEPVMLIYADGDDDT